MTLGDYFDSIVDSAKEEMAEEVRREVTEAVRREMAEELTKEVTETVTKEVTKEVTAQNIKAVVEILQEYCDTKENAAIKLRSKFPEYAGQAKELVDKYWKESR